MKFFKHFVDAHRGRTIQTLFDEFGHMGVSCYWTLVEICAEKLEKQADEEFTEEHCYFVFHESYLRKNLKINRKNLRLFFEKLSEISQIFPGNFPETLENSGKFLSFHFPKLLESLDRDARRARQNRPKIKKKIKSCVPETVRAQSAHPAQSGTVSSNDKSEAGSGPETGQVWPEGYKEILRDGGVVSLVEALKKNKAQG